MALSEAYIPTSNPVATQSEEKSSREPLLTDTKKSSEANKNADTAVTKKAKSDLLEPGEIPKAQAASSSRAAASTSSAQSIAQLENSLVIGVFHRDTDISLPSDKWPTVKNLLAWLDKNPDCNIQSAYANIKVVSQLELLPLYNCDLSYIVGSSTQVIPRASRWRAGA